MNNLSDAFPRNCMLDQEDVIHSLKSLCLQTIACSNQQLLLSTPLHVLEEVERLTELKRKTLVHAPVDEAWLNTKHALLHQGHPSLKLSWPSLRDLLSLFARPASTFEALEELQICGSQEKVPLEKIALACPNLRKLDLRSLSLEVMFAPIAKMSKLKSLRINSCENVFSSVADGDHDWLAQLENLEELNLSRTSVTYRMLPKNLSKIRVLDLSFTFVNDLALICDQMQSVEHLVFGSDEDSEVNQLEVFPDIRTQFLPSLQVLDLFVPVRET